MKFIELNKELKDNVNNVYNIVGDDAFLVKQAISTFKYCLIKDFEEFDYVKVDADTMKANEADAIISTLPMVNEYRLIVFVNPSAEVVKLLNKYDFNGLNVVVVCVNAEKLSVGETVDCGKLDKTDITKYVLNYLAKNKKSIEERALDYLIEATGSNMSKISNELNKLVAYCNDEEVIDINVVTSLVSNASEYAIFMLTNAIDNKDYTTYQKIINEMSKSLSMSELFSYIGKHFKRMQYVALNKNDEELSKILNIKPYAVKLSRQNVAKNGIKFYINLYEKYVDLDYQIKSGKITAANALYELVF